MNSDFEKLQGAWNIVAFEVDGRKMPAGAFSGARIVVDGAKFTSLSMGATYEGTLHLDASRNPKTLDMQFTAGPEKGNTNHAIYEFAGDETWTLCIDMTGRARPTSFATTKGSGHALETLQRAGADAPQPHPAIDGLEPVPELEGEWRMVSCIRSGAALEPMLLKSARRIAKGNETTTLFGKQVFMHAKYAVDRTKSPMTVDFYLSTGETQHGIYELDGPNFKVCFAAPGDARPTEFTSAPGDGRTLTVWTRTASA